MNQEIIELSGEVPEIDLGPGSEAPEETKKKKRKYNDKAESKAAKTSAKKPVGLKWFLIMTGILAVAVCMLVFMSDYIACKFAKFNMNCRGTDFKIDVDNDGVNELLCNKLESEDFTHVVVFRVSGDDIVYGEISLPEEYANLHPVWGPRAVKTAYDEKTKEVQIDYYAVTREFIETKYVPLERCGFSYTQSIW